jgi:hypothetical protein
MGEKTTTATGGCMCGAIRYEATGEPRDTGYCHCADCRRHNGAPVVCMAMFEAGQVRFTKGERKVYASSPGVGRAFCGNCGTPLTWEAEFEDRLFIELHISTFDNPDAFVPKSHWFHSRRIAWFDVADNLPRYEEEGTDDKQPYRHGPATKGPPAGT